MSISTETRRSPAGRRASQPMSATKRKTLATKQLLDALAGSDQTAAITAALEAVNEQLIWDSAFKRSLHQRYEELTTLSAASRRASLGPAPKPISGPDLDHFT